MNRDTALAISDYLATRDGQGVEHHVKYSPGNGYVVRLYVENLADDTTDEIMADIRDLADKDPIHGREYR